MIELGKLIEISEPGVNAGELTRVVGGRLAARQQQARARGLDYLHLVDEPALPLETDPAQHDLVAELQFLRRSGEGLRQEPIITDWRVPLVNGLLTQLKRPLHALALMYVNNLATRQIVVNRIMRWTLEGLVGARQAERARLAELEQEVAQLRERLAQLESQFP